MPAKYPRLTITMRPALHAMLRRLSELTGQSQSKLIFELLDGAEPVLSRVIRILEAAEAAQGDLRGHLTQGMLDAQERIEQQLALTLDKLGEDDVPDLLATEGPQHRRRKRSLQAAGGAPRSGDAGRPEGAPTPMSNRGVRSLTSTTKVANLRRAK